MIVRELLRCVENGENSIGETRRAFGVQTTKYGQKIFVPNRAEIASRIGGLFERFMHEKFCIFVVPVA